MSDNFVRLESKHNVKCKDQLLSLKINSLN